MAGAERAAGLMGLQVLRLTDPAQAERAAKLPQGRLFASGRALVPLVKDAVLDAVFKTTDVSTAEQDAAAAFDDLVEPTGGVPATTYSAITVGSLVLVGEVYPQCGWYEAIVIAAPGDDLFALRWRDWPDDPPVARRRDDLALLPPGSVAAASGYSTAGTADER
jgi:hypothetical protein